MMRVRSIPMALILIVLSTLIGFPGVSAQQVNYTISNGFVKVYVGDLLVNIAPTSGICNVSLSNHILLMSIGWEIRDSSDNLIAETYKLGILDVTPPTVTEVEGGLMVVTSSKVPLGTSPSFEIKTTFVIYSTGLILINTTIRAYTNTESGTTRFVLSLPIDVFSGHDAYFILSNQEVKTSLPSKYKTYTLYDGPLAIMYSSSGYGDVIVISNSPEEIDSVRLDDLRKYGSNYYTLKLEGLSLSGVLASGTSVNFSLLIYVHNKGPEFTNRIVTVFRYLKDVYASMQSLSKKTPRTPGGRKVLRECIQEYAVARKAFMKGDFDNAYSHALKAMDLVKSAQSIEVKQRILFYIVIPDIVLLILIVFAIKTSRTKAFKESFKS